MEISFKTFEQLTKHQLYTLLQLRQRVFIQEQQSIYDDIDGLDFTAVHVIASQSSDDIAGYTRLRIDEKSHRAFIERVVMAPQSRGSGAGHKLMKAVIEYCTVQYSAFMVQLSAQIEVLDFYRKLGFVEQGEPYDDGGIMHKTMVLKSSV